MITGSRFPYLEIRVTVRGCTVQNWAYWTPALMAMSWCLVPRPNSDLAITFHCGN